MRRYALPIIILVVTVGLLALIALSSTGAPNYGVGNPTTQALSDEWVVGTLDGRAILVEYSDFQCPACALYEPLVVELREKYGDRMAFVYRHFPLTTIHQHADLAARAAEAAGRQGKFWEMHDMLFASQKSWESLVSAEPLFDQFAQQLGLNMEQYERDLESEAVRQAVADDYARGLRDGVQGTPTFYLNGTKIELQSVEAFDAALAAILGA